jgi:hypothetical protein
MQPRVFNNNQTKQENNIFFNKNTNEQTIADLALYFQNKFENKSDSDSNDISKLLFNIQSFMAATDHDYQTDRDKRISEEKIVQILNKHGNAMKDFYDNHIQYKNLGVTNQKREVIDAFIYCEKAMLNQLEIMKNNNDKIYLYFENHQNILKDILTKHPEIKTTLNKK